MTTSRATIPMSRDPDPVAAGGGTLSGAPGERGYDNVVKGAFPPRREAARPAPRQVKHRLIEFNWVLLVPAFLGAALLLAILSASLPPLLSALALTGGTALAAAARTFARIERGLSAQSMLRFALLGAAIFLPAALFGFAVASWTTSGSGPEWPFTLGTVVIVGSIAAFVLNGRLASSLAGQVGLWLGVNLASGTPGSFLVLTAGAVVGSIAAWRQGKADAEEESRQAELTRTQHRAEEILNDYEQTGQGWFWETDRRGAITYVSATVGQVLGRNPASLLGRHFTELFAGDPMEQATGRSLAFHLTARSPFQDLAVRAGTTLEERWWAITGRPIQDGLNNFIGFRGSGSDLTEKRRSQEHAARLAHYDSLTGLANRLQMSKTLEKILSAQSVEHRACAVLLLDLDRFKHVNDTLGHPSGDALLRQVARRLEQVVGKLGQVGRLGGDEFEVIVPGKTPRTELARLAESIIVELSQAYAIENHRVVIGASVGIAVATVDGETPDALIRNADLALYAAKDAGRGRHHFYSADLHNEAEERRQLEQDLRDALINGGFELYYQPVVHTMTERITGFEALLRWDHPTRGPMSPARFIPLAEDAGLITQIGEWALRTACRDLRNWPESVRVAVNVSALQFANPSLPVIVTNALAAAQVDPGRLELEITESVYMNEDENSEAMFEALKRVGVRLSLDDFGTGCSSLGYLKRAPFDKIKIDQGFVRGATVAGSRNGAIIASIVSLAEALGMETTAEGVETLDELELVRMLGCSHVQGYIYEKPMSAEDAARKLQTGLTAIARGPRSARAARQSMLRRVVLEHSGQRYHGVIRNISVYGAMIEGLWNVPAGTIFRVAMPDGLTVTATARWCNEDRMGVEFAQPMPADMPGRTMPNQPEESAVSAGLRHTG